MAADGEALLEWVNSLEASSSSQGAKAARLEDLADGELLLEVMRDLNAEGFRGPGGKRRPALPILLDGLLEHFRGRPGSGEAEAKRLLRHAESSEGVDPAGLTRLVIWATLENELPKQQRYVEACQELSFASQQAVMMIAQQFRDMDPEGGSQPPTPSGGASGFRSPLISGALADRRRLNSDLPDFLEVGLDAESRFRRLKEHYIMLKEDQERWEEERASLRWEVEAERGKRQEAEEAERMARAELRLAEEVRDRGKEDQRAIFEIRLEREVASCREELRLRDREAEALREELDLARVQAKTAQRLASQLEMFKKKIEECQSWKREKEDLRQQLDELMSSRQSGAGSMDHLHSRLAGLRDEVAVVSRERDEAQLQLRVIQEELDKSKASARSAAEELRQLRRGQMLDGGNANGSTSPTETLASATAAAGSSRPRHAALEVPPSDSLSGPQAPTRSPKAAGVEEIRGLMAKDDLLERLLAEKERATRAETTLQLKQAEVTSLGDQRTKDSAQISSLEGQIKELTSSGGGSSAGESAALRELQAQLSLRERELQVHSWRSRAESTSLLAQEALMSGCFHELGLRYHRLKAKHDLLLDRLQGSASRDSGGKSAGGDGAESRLRGSEGSE
ncbi:unnamed protein product [Polarella glacialis]|uniref:Uncharacterized protein n=2 Tax=Polarella glacialis TaxID=89957 RepID=A0A813FHK1_POLGL|nr:unnamed protein product [Polarella glacialis]